MPRNNYDPAFMPADFAPGDPKCPKCGVEMEAIQSSQEAPQLEQLQLCPSCYLVVWSDDKGLHVRQGVPVKKNSNGGIDA